MEDVHPHPAKQMRFNNDAPASQAGCVATASNVRHQAEAAGRGFPDEASAACRAQTPNATACRLSRRERHSSWDRSFVAPIDVGVLAPIAPCGATVTASPSGKDRCRMLGRIAARLQMGCVGRIV